MDSYTEYKKKEYFLLISKLIQSLQNSLYEKELNQQAAATYIELVRKYSDKELSQLKVQPAAYQQKLVDSISAGMKTLFRNHFRKVIQTAWLEAFNLGTRHELMDCLYSIDDYKKKLDKGLGFKVKISLDNIFDQVSLSSHILSNNLAEFRSEEDKRNDSRKTAQMDREQKAQYLRAVREISNVKDRAEALRPEFLSDFYMRERYRVLTEDYASNHDSVIRHKIAKYLGKDPKGIDKVRSRTIQTTVLRNEIAAELEKSGVEDNINPYSKAIRIIRTEVNMAYNFGKLSAFTGGDDIYALAQWNVNFEVAKTNKDYEICKECMAMNGRTYTVMQLLQMGTLIDTGMLSYTGENKTEWKNSNKPSVPAHPNCIVDGTSILMYNKEYKNISNVTVGDYVYVPTLQEKRKVIQTHKNWYGSQQSICKIRLADGTELTCTENHPIWTDEGWLNAGRVTEGITLYTHLKESNSCDRRLHTDSKLWQNSKKNKDLRMHNFQDVETKQTSSNKRGSFIREKQIPKTTRSLFQQHEEKQPYVYERSCLQGKRFTIRERYSQTFLPNKKRKGALQIRFQRRFTTFFQKLLGSKLCQNIESLQNSMGVRKKDRFIRWQSLFSRFLPSSIGLLHRSERLLDRRRESQMGTVQEGLSSKSNTSSRSTSVQTNGILTQKLNPVRVVAIEKYYEPQYVYNLSIEGDEMYFANDVLVHNCSCFWSIKRSKNGQIERLFEARDTKDLLNTVRELLPVAVGVGLIVTGAFLLSRANAYQAFSRAIKKNIMNNVGVTTNWSDQVENVTDIMVQEFGIEETNNFLDIITDISSIDPDLLT